MLGDWRFMDERVLSRLFGFAVFFTILALAIVWFPDLFTLPTVNATTHRIPTVQSVFINTSPGTLTDGFSSGIITPNSGATRTIYINGIVQDVDGKANIQNVKTVFYRSGVANGFNCTANTSNCYIVASCALTDNGNKNQQVYSCQIDFAHYIDATDASSSYSAQNWLVYVLVTDFGGNSGTISNGNKEMASLLSLNIPATMNFGTLNVGQATTSSNNVEMVISNYGNVIGSVTVSMGASMTCSIGSIDPGNIRWNSPLDAGYYDGGTALTGSSATIPLSLSMGTPALPLPGKAVFWNILIPYGVKGSCTGATAINAIAG